ESRAADQRGSAGARRPGRHGFSESDFGAAVEPAGASTAGAGNHHAGARRRTGGACALRGGEDRWTAVKGSVGRRKRLPHKGASARARKWDRRFRLSTGRGG